MKRFQLHSTVTFVQGALYSLLIDTQKNRVFRINVCYSKILVSVIGSMVDEFKNHPLCENVNRFIDDLMHKEIGDYIEGKVVYEGMHFNEYSFGELENAILEYQEDNYELLNLSIGQLNKAGCKFLEIRFLDKPSIDVLNGLLRSLDSSIISGVTILFKEGIDASAEDLYKILENNYRVNRVYIFSARENKLISRKSGDIYFIRDEFNVHLCGSVAVEFSANNYHINVAKRANTCLYKKVYISKDGNVQNCPSLQRIYGNIHSEPLLEIISRPDFRVLWELNKDDISVCRQCEYRYICTDCRAYLEDPDDILSKPLKCGYDPYTGEWSEWSTNPLKQKAIDFYGMREFLDKI